ncbi:TlpA family protein disulfide reductase [Olivibacter oleidegradans]|uniref:TlpA family protein disulfide reductase n=1 Tax=Olivibacter oleidegradans TaxID=760123 RepID=A0ABV6HEB4_9SPHI
MIKTEPIENSKSDRRLAEKELQITRKLAQLVGPWLQLAFVEKRDAKKIWRNAKKFWRNALTQWRDAKNAMPNAVNKGRNTICRGRTSILRDKLPNCSSVPGRMTVSGDKRRDLACARKQSLMMNDELLVMNMPTPRSYHETDLKGIDLRLGRLAEKEPPNARKLPQLVGKWVQPACAQWRDAANAMPNAVNGGRNAFNGRRNAKKFRRDAIAQWRDAANAMPKAVNGGRNAGTEGRNTIWKGRNAKKFKRNAIAQWRDATNPMPNAVNRGRNADTEGQNAIWRGQNASLCFSISTTLFCAFQYLLGRTAIFRDERRGLAGAREQSLMMNDELLVMNITCTFPRERYPKLLAANLLSKLVPLLSFYYPKLWRPVISCRADAPSRLFHNIFGKSVNLTLGRNTEIRDKLPIYSAVPGRTTANRDELSFCTFSRKRYPKLLAAKFLCKLLRLLSLCYPKFWRPVISCRADIPSTPFRSIYRKGVNLRLGRPAEKAPQITRKLPQLVGKWLQPAFVEKRDAIAQWRDAANAMPKAVNRGRNAGTEGRNTIWKGRNALNGERNAKKIWRNAKKFGRNASALTQGAIPSRDRFFGLLCKWVSRTLKPYTIYLTALKILFCVCLAHARQSSSPEAAHGVALSTESIKPLKIGDSIPEALWNLPLQMVKAGKDGSTTVKLSDYKGKLIILDFWATWCGGCIKEMPKIGSLIKEYQKDLTLLSVTAQDEVTVKAFFARRQELIDLNLQLITDASALTSYFPHRLVPHIVWIGADGTFLAATSSGELNTERLQLLVNGKAPSFTSVKEDILDVDYNKPLLVKEPDDDFSYLYNANLSAYRNGYQSRLGQTTDSSKFRLYAINVPLLSIFKWGLNLPVSWYRNRISFDDGLSDETLWMSGKSEAEIRKNSYCYELIVPTHLKASAKTFLLRDMERYFGYQATVEQREVNCLVLRCKDGRPDRSDVVSGFNNLSDTSTAIKTLSGQVPYFFVDYLNKLLDFKPVLDETGIDYHVDISFDSDEVRDLKKINKSLAKHHLVLEEERRPIKMLIISKKSTNP